MSLAPAGLFGVVRQRIERWECPALTDSARDRPCAHCGASGPNAGVVAAHANEAIMGRAGFGGKAHDVFVAFLCHSCHDYVDGRAPSEPLGIWGPTYEDRREVWRRAFFVSLTWLTLEGWIRPPGKA